MTRVPHFDRRLLLQSALATSFVSFPALRSIGRMRRDVSISIAKENLRPGTDDWILQRHRVDEETRYRSSSVEGYCSHTSVRAGEKVSISVSTAPASDVSLDIYRMGYYGGGGGRWMMQLGPVACDTQPDPPTGPRRMRRCTWPATFQFTIPLDWPSGIYVGKLTAHREGWQSYVIFIVRDDRPADLLFQCSDHTWQAYNRWPSQFSLYDDGKNEWYWGPNSCVSFDRPYGMYCQIVDQPLSIGSGEFFLWEYPFVYWMEANGYDVTYCSNQDTHYDPLGIQRARGFLSVGHDEYWTSAMFRHVRQAIDAGVCVGFFSGNAVCGEVEYDGADRSLRRVGVFGPPGGTREFASMSDLPHRRPYANALMGAHSTGPVTGGADWICTAPNHWIYRETAMQQGDTIPGIIGWEWHGDAAPIRGLEVVARGPTHNAPGQPNGGEYTATVYPGPRDNFVFNAATCWWADGLSEPPGYVRPQVYTAPQGPHASAQQITHNVLRRMIDRDSTGPRS